MNKDSPFPIRKWFLLCVLILTFLMTLLDFLFNHGGIESFSVLEIRNILFYLILSVLSNSILLALMALVFVPLYKRFKISFLQNSIAALPFFAVFIPYVLMWIAYSRFDNNMGLLVKVFFYLCVSSFFLILLILCVGVTRLTRLISIRPKLLGSMLKASFALYGGFFILFGVLFVISFQSPKMNKDPNHPNIILIVEDALRKDFVGAYGFPLETTPCLDRLAHDGILFESAMASSMSSIPGHASILFGEEVEEHKAFGNNDVIVEKKASIADYLRKRGYSTFGICRNPLISSWAGFAQGFDFYWSWGDRFLPNAPLSYTFSILPVSQIIIRVLNLDLTNVYSKMFFKADNQPFFCFAQYLYTHTPYRDLSKPPWITKERRKRIRDLLESGKLPNETSWPMDKVSRVVSTYAASVYYADSILKDLIQDLSKKNLIDNTLFIITADHGENLVDHGEEYAQKHDSHFNTSIHIPLIAWSPSLQFQGIRISGITSQAKIKTLVTDAASDDSVLYSTSPDLEALKKLMCKEEHFAFGGNTFVLYDQNYKYVANVPGQKNIHKLFKWREDFYDKNNLSPDNEEIAQDMQKRLSAILDQNNIIEALNVKRKLSKEQIRNLKALGYIK